MQHQGRMKIANLIKAVALSVDRVNDPFTAKMAKTLPTEEDC